MQNSKEKRKRGRPPSGHPGMKNLTIRLSPSLRAKLEEKAKTAGVSLSAIVRFALERQGW